MVGMMMVMMIVMVVGFAYNIGKTERKREIRFVDESE